MQAAAAAPIAKAKQKADALISIWSCIKRRSYFVRRRAPSGSLNRDSPDRGLDQAEIAAAEGVFQAGNIATGRHCASDDSGSSGSVILLGRLFHRGS
jgi:hypothetical protein